jgi:hypothetical protein
MLPLVVIAFACCVTLLLRPVSAWYVQKLSVQTPNDCDVACTQLADCTAWTATDNIHDANINGDHDNSDGNSTPRWCYLQSAVLESLERSRPDIFGPAPATATQGHTRSHHSLPADYKVETLIHGPVVLDSSSLFNFERHFVRGCSYTVALWVWIWKKRQYPYSENEDDETSDKYDSGEREPKHQWADAHTIFSTRRINPPTSSAEPLVPTLMFNVGRPINHDRVFFAASMDRQGYYTGVWANNHNVNTPSPKTKGSGESGRIRYHEWVHYALTVNETTLVAYVNGEFSEYVHLFPRGSKNSNDVCPYANWTLDAHSLLQNKIPDVPVANTIFQVGGNRGEECITGMVQDVIVVSNKALDQTGIHQLMGQEQQPHQQSSHRQTHVHKPRFPLPTMTHMMRDLYNIHSLEGLCTVDWSGDSYLMYSWGLCPDTVCGSICLPEEFFLDIDYVDNHNNHDNHDVASANNGNYSRHFPNPAAGKGPVAALAQTIGSLLDPEYVAELRRYRDIMDASQDADPESAPTVDYDQLSMDIFGIPMNDLEDMIDTYITTAPTTTPSKASLAEQSVDDGDDVAEDGRDEDGDENDEDDNEADVDDAIPLRDTSKPLPREAAKRNGAARRPLSSDVQRTLEKMHKIVSQHEKAFMANANPVDDMYDDDVYYSDAEVEYANKLMDAFEAEGIVVTDELLLQYADQYPQAGIDGDDYSDIYGDTYGDADTSVVDAYGEVVANDFERRLQQELEGTKHRPVNDKKKSTMTAKKATKAKEVTSKPEPEQKKDVVREAADAKGSLSNAKDVAAVTTAASALPSANSQLLQENKQTHTPTKLEKKEIKMRQRNSGSKRKNNKDAKNMTIYNNDAASTDKDGSLYTKMCKAVSSAVSVAARTMTKYVPALEPYITIGQTKTQASLQASSAGNRLSGPNIQSSPLGKVQRRQQAEEFLLALMHVVTSPTNGTLPRDRIGERMLQVLHSVAITLKLCTNRVYHVRRRKKYTRLLWCG